MSKTLINLILLILIQQIISNPCIEGKNNCTKCDYINQLCIKCNKDILIPDENGGCKPAKKCSTGINFCQQCDENSNLCKLCEEYYFPDENGGCTYTDNCEISYKGECIKCKDDFILVGEKSYLFDGFILCKSVFSHDFKKCEEIDIRHGKCLKCKEGFYLSLIDHRCIETEHCLESIYGQCKECTFSYYLDKKENKCKQQQEGIFAYCKQTINGKTCDICNDGYYFDEEGNCTEINYCSKSENGKCIECIEDYYLISPNYRPGCSKDKNCYEADKDSGLCLQCNKNYFIDYKDGKCKSNLENNEFKYCKSAREFCNNCLYGYYLGEDLKCSNTIGCLESNNGICNICSEGYYLGFDNKCSLIKYCIYSKDEYNCDECENGYFYHEKNKTCLIGDDNFKNCKILKMNDRNCSLCRDNYYLNKSDNLCYNNEEFGYFYKCSYTDIFGKICDNCIKDYYYGHKYNICSPIEGCEMLKDENTCSECGDYYCLDVKKGNCVDNYDIIDDKLFYFRCNQSNEEGNGCQICIDNLTLNDDNGLCVDQVHCEEEIDGICQKCMKFEEDYTYYCLNSILGCVEVFDDKCLECNNITDLFFCTKCEDGYEIDEYGNCIKIKEEKN